MHRVFIMNVVPKYIISASSRSTFQLLPSTIVKKNRNAQHANDREEKLTANTVTARRFAHFLCLRQTILLKELPQH